MEKEILEEINRFRKLSGLELINEQGGRGAQIDNLLALTGSRIKNLDDILKGLGLLNKKDLTIADVDALCDELAEHDVMLPNDLLKFRKQLKANIQMRNSLFNNSSDFISYIKGLKRSVLDDLVGLNLVISLNKLQLQKIAKSIYTKLMTVANSNVKLSFDNLDSVVSSQLQKAYDKGFIFHDTDEMWDVIDGIILEDANGLGLSDEMAEEQFNTFKQKIRQSSKTKDIIDKINADGRNLKSGKRTTDVTFSKDYKVPEEWLGGNKWRAVDENGIPKKVETVDQTVDTLDDAVIAADNKLPQTIDEVEDIFDEYELIDDGTGGGPTPNRDPIPNGAPDRRFFNNFFFKYCKLGFCEVIINILRSLGKNPQDFVDDMIKTQDKIIELTNKLETMNPGDSGYFSVKFELDGYINRLKSNTNMMSTPSAGFQTQWDLVKKQIKETLGSEHSDLANKVINYCENKAITSGGVTVTGLNPLENFIELMTKHTDEGAMGGFILDLRKIATPEYWAAWRNTGIVKYGSEVKDYYKTVVDKNNDRIIAFFKSIGKVALDFLNQLFRRYVNYMTFGTFRYYKDIMKRLSKGSFTSMEGLKRYAALYVEITIISNIIEPFFNYVTDTFKNIIEYFNIYDFPEEEVSPQEKLINDLKERIPVIGNNFEWNPFFNPIGFVPGVGEVGELLGFEKAPLPDFIANGIFAALGFGFERGQEKMNKDVTEQQRKIKEAYFQKLTTEELDKINSSATIKYNKDKEGVEAANGKEKLQNLINIYSDTDMLFKDANFDLLEPSDTEKILKALTFTPGVPPDLENQVLDRERNKKRSVVDKNGTLIGIFYPNENVKFIPNKFGEDAGYKPSQDIPKDAKVEYPDVSTMIGELGDVSGYWSLKSKDGKLYLLKKQSGYLFFVTPSVDEIRKNPNKQLVMNDLQKFVPYLP